MTEKELSFTCAYCQQNTTVVVEVTKSLATQSRDVTRVYYCEHCSQANRIPLPDNLDVHVFILGKDKGFLRYMNDGTPLLQGEKEQ